MPSPSDFISAFKAFSGFEPYAAQREAIFHDGGPLWILAGPGTGKTEVLVLRTLRLLLLDGVLPESLVLTTFTEKAARNLHDRLSNYLVEFSRRPEFRAVKKPDISRIWLGTLHSLAHRILLEMDEKSEDLELLDESASLFLFLKTIKSKHTFGAAADEIYRAVTGEDPAVWAGRMGRAQAFLSAAHRVVEDNLDALAFHAGKPIRGRKERWPSGTREEFLAILDTYEKKLGKQVDFARVQRCFLEFLESGAARAFLEGDEERKLPGIEHVIVDEYQDTNPIQEAIYFSLARGGRNLTVVGDDDQALYRFRGASVDAMVQFESRCTKALGVPSVGIVSLNENRRSHSKIVEAVNRYLKAATKVSRFGEARAPKGDLVARANVIGSHIPVAVLVREDEESCGKDVAKTVRQLRDAGSIDDLRQVALLASSTRETGRSGFKAYAEAFDAEGLPLFNPRAKDLHKDPNLLAILGALVTVLDPEGTYPTGRLTKFVARCGRALADLPRATELHRWVGAQASAFRAAPKAKDGRFYDRSLLDIFYRVLGFEPFRTEVDATGGPHAALMSWRIAQLTGLIAGFEAAQGTVNIPRATDTSRSWFHIMRREPPSTLKGVDCWYAYNFIRDLMGTFGGGGFDDAEDEIVAFPPEMVPALTIHQAKGLEFSIVFVCAIQPSRGAGPSHHQEDLFAGYRRHAVADKFTREERATHDIVRQHFVAFSRAKYGLVLCLERKTYEDILRGGRVAASYPHLPSAWLREFPRI